MAGYRNGQDTRMGRPLKWASHQNGWATGMGGPTNRKGYQDGRATDIVNFTGMVWLLE